MCVCEPVSLRHALKHVQDELLAAACKMAALGRRRVGLEMTAGAAEVSGGHVDDGAAKGDARKDDGVAVGGHVCAPSCARATR